MLATEATVDLFFPLSGTSFPSDNGYLLYSAISRLLPQIHGADWFTLHTVKGRIIRPGIIKIGPAARLGFRLPIGKIAEFLALAGARLDLDNHSVRCGIPQIHRLIPSPDLWCRLVVIKQAHTKGNILAPEAFLEAINRQLSQKGVRATATLEPAFQHVHDEMNARRILKVKNICIPGYGVYLRNLTDDDSIRIQTSGLGGRRRLGCGVFSPVKGEHRV